MIIFLFAAAETGQLKLMLYMHGKKFYQLLSGGEKQDICFERIKKIGRILGMDERYLIGKGRELSLTSSKNPLNFDHFQLYYFKIFSEINPDHLEEPIVNEEKEVPLKIEKTIERQEPSVVPSKKKSSCAGCKSKACNLL